MAMASWVAPTSDFSSRTGPADSGPPRSASTWRMASKPVEDVIGPFEGRHRELRPFGFQPIDGEDPGRHAQGDRISGQSAANVPRGVPDHDDSSRRVTVS